jgi:hypothetical protein
MLRGATVSVDIVASLFVDRAIWQMRQLASFVIILKERAQRDGEQRVREALVERARMENGYVDIEAPGTGRPVPARIVVADDHPIFRQRLKDLLREFSVPDLEVVGEARDGQDTGESFSTSGPIVNLEDYQSGQGGWIGVGAARSLSAERISSTSSGATSTSESSPGFVIVPLLG